MRKLQKMRNNTDYVWMAVGVSQTGAEYDAQNFGGFFHEKKVCQRIV
jgi:hypothetical protein